MAAIADLGGAPETCRAEPDIRPRQGRGKLSVFAGESEQRWPFVDKWRVARRRVTNARHRSLLRVILGETLEHKRFFDQTLAGRTDLLGRRADGAGTGGGVLLTRWLGGEQT